MLMNEGEPRHDVQIQPDTGATEENMKNSEKGEENGTKTKKENTKKGNRKREGKENRVHACKTLCYLAPGPESCCRRI